MGKIKPLRKKKSELEMFISDKVDFKAKKLSTYKERGGVIIWCLFTQEMELLKCMHLATDLPNSNKS